MIRPGEIVVDNFAVGGGASAGMELGLGCHVDIAINHDKQAIEMHKINHHKKEMLKVYRKTLTTISRLKLISLRVGLEAIFDSKDFQFYITITNSNEDNRTFYLYDFQSLVYIKSTVDKTIKAIKTDNFYKIIELSGWQTEKQENQELETIENE